MGQVYFFNLTSQDLSLNVNGFNGDKIRPLPGAPYTPNTSQNTYTRYDTAQPQQNQVGTQNTISYKLGSGGSGGTVNVGINVDFGAYSADKDLLVYLYAGAVIVMCPTDSRPYLGRSGSTIQVGPGSPNELEPEPAVAS